MWPLLEGVLDGELREILQIARRRSFARNEVVCHRGDPADSCHLIAAGRFAIRIVTSLGDTVTVAIRGLGATFGEMALLAHDAKRTAIVAVLEKGETYLIYRSDLGRIRAKHPGAERFLWAFLVNEMRGLWPFRAAKREMIDKLFRQTDANGDHHLQNMEVRLSS